MTHPPAPHALFPAAGRPLALLAAGGLIVLLAGCGTEPANPDATSSAAASSAVPTSSTPASSTPASSTAPSASSTDTPADQVRLDIRLENGTVSPNGRKIDIRKGQTVALTVTSDHDDEVHVHGDYDIELPVSSGTSVTKSFVADKTGSVEVESHHPEKIIAILNVR
ncbi:MAG: hypothetical protein ACR2LI_01285 [Propionibacteriaceae bacterium]